MAKKKAGGDSKKSVQKKQQQVIEDKTFGLKNKNKSKKVQQKIQSIEKNVLHSGDPKLRKLEEQRRQAKAEAKARKKAMQEEQNALFGEALLAVQKKSTTNQKFGKVEAIGRDADDDAAKKGTSRAMKMMYQMDAQEMADKLKEDVSVLVVQLWYHVTRSNRSLSHTITCRSPTMCQRWKMRLKINGSKRWKK